MNSVDFLEFNLFSTEGQTPYVCVFTSVAPFSFFDRLQSDAGRSVRLLSALNDAL